LQDKEGSLRACLGLLPEGHGLALYDEEHRVRATLSVSLAGCPALGLYDRSGTVRAGVSLAADGEPAIILIDSRGKPMFRKQ
jgi:hypothetical protein